MRKVGRLYSSLFSSITLMCGFTDGFARPLDAQRTDTNSMAIEADRILATQGFVGTISVSHDEVTRSGTLEGCSLVYKVVFPDTVYRKGRLHIAVGNITLSALDNGNVVLSLKLGSRLLSSNDDSFEPPHFAYFVTSGGSSAKTESVSFDGEEGFRVFAFSMTDPAFNNIFQGLLDDKQITIGFSRKDGSLDQRFVVDLLIEDSDMVNEKLVKTRSDNAKKKFFYCTGALFKDTIKKLESKE